MKKILFVLFIVLNCSFLTGQNAKIKQQQNFVIGLAKVSPIQLEFVKDKFAGVSSIVTAEFVSLDNILLIETDTSGNTPVLSYEEVKKILLDYFNQNDIYEKDHTLFDQMKAEYQKHDKFILK